MIWFRTDTGITRHRDFVSLRLALGLGRHAVAGHMLCLFEAVAEHHETGNLAGVSDTVIEDWAEWHGEAGKFVTAMRDSGWLTATNELHGWYKRHASMLSARTKKKEELDAARAASRKDKAEAKKGASKVSEDGPRPSKTNLDEFGRSIPTGPDRTGPSTDEQHSSAPPAPTSHDRVNELFERWNALAKFCGLPVAAQITPKRRAAAQARIKAGLLDRWPEFAAALEASRWHRGENDRGWRANVDWLLRPDSWIGLVERAAVVVAPPAPTLNIREVVREAVLAVMPESGDAIYDGKPCWLSRGYHGEFCAHPPDRKYLIEIDRDVESEVAPLSSKGREAVLEAAKSALLRRVKLVLDEAEVQSAR